MPDTNEMKWSGKLAEWLHEHRYVGAALPVTVLLLLIVYFTDPFFGPSDSGRAHNEASVSPGASLPPVDSEEHRRAELSRYGIRQSGKQWCIFIDEKAQGCYPSAEMAEHEYEQPYRQVGEQWCVFYGAYKLGCYPTAEAAAKARRQDERRAERESARQEREIARQERRRARAAGGLTEEQDRKLGRDLCNQAVWLAFTNQVLNEGKSTSDALRDSRLNYDSCAGKYGR